MISLDALLQLVAAVGTPFAMGALGMLVKMRAEQAAHGARLDSVDQRGDRHSRELAAVRDDVEGLKRSAA